MQWTFETLFKWADLETKMIESSHLPPILDTKKSKQQ